MDSLYEDTYFSERDGDSRRDEMYRQEMERISKLIDLKAGGKVLDVGCGQGEFLDLFGDNWEKLGIEISQHAAQVCMRKGIRTTSMI